ncbi:MFS transporter [Streptosporangium sp. NPDC051023]|uniref:MFS transporter n=1 Tax=Streptosporangium sp. NPDC051023 TaxID=3155410 RepID=UPI00344CBCD6
MGNRTMTGHTAALVLITAVELVVFLDTTVVNIALPSISAGLRLDEAGLAWVTNAYLLAFGGCMLVGGRAADLLGARRVFAFGLALFTAASALAGLAGSPWMLVAARAAQGIGAAVTVPAQLALLTRTFTEPAAHRRAFAVWGAMGAAGAAIGTATGGLPASFVGVTAPAVTAVDQADAGVTAGIVNTAQRIGSGLGVTAILVLASMVTGTAGYLAGLRTGFAAAAALAFLGCLLTLALLRPNPLATPVAGPAERSHR